jgi:outer membrane protein assembly factor BamB
MTFSASPFEEEREHSGVVCGGRRRLSVRPLASLVALVLGVFALGGEATVANADALGWVHSGLRPVSQPAAIADRFVFYAASGGGLRVVALNASSGTTAWSAVASPSVVAPGEAPQLAIVDGLVVYIREVRDQVAELVASDPATGHEVWHSEPAAFTTWPALCTGDSTTVCVTGNVSSQPNQTSLLRFNGRTGASLPSPVISSLGVGRAIADGLFDPGIRAPGVQTLVAADGATVSWTQPLASIYNLAGASTDWGWNIDRLTKPALFVGSVGTKPLVYSQSRVVADLSDTMIAGFRISDGTLVWRTAGASYACNELPCVGAIQAGYSSPANVDADGPSVGVALRSTGTVIGSPSSDTTTVSTGARATIEGFDPATGRILWRFAAGHNLGLLESKIRPPQVGSNSIVLNAPGGGLVTLNLANGSRKKTEAAAPAWCRNVVEYHEHIPYSSGTGISSSLYIGQFGLYPCTSAKAARPTPDHVPAFVGAIGAQADGLIAWSESTGIVAARA